jgi:hypothetical protein
LLLALPCFHLSAPDVASAACPLQRAAWEVSIHSLPARLQSGLRLTPSCGSGVERWLC